MARPKKNTESPTDYEPKKTDNRVFIEEITEGDATDAPFPASKPASAKDDTLAQILINMEAMQRQISSLVEENKTLRAAAPASAAPSHSIAHTTDKKSIYRAPPPAFRMTPEREEQIIAVLDPWKGKGLQYKFDELGVTLKRGAHSEFINGSSPDRIIARVAKFLWS